MSLVVFGQIWLVSVTCKSNAGDETHLESSFFLSPPWMSGSPMGMGEIAFNEFMIAERSCCDAFSYKSNPIWYAIKLLSWNSE